MTKRQFILDTLLPYKQDPSTCAINENGLCLYLTEDGRKCAVGKHMLEGEWQNLMGDVNTLSTEYDLDEGLDGILTPEASKQGLSLATWNRMQQYHDKISRLIKINDPSIADYANKQVEALQLLNGGIDLSELLIATYDEA